MKKLKKLAIIIIVIILLNGIGFISKYCKTLGVKVDYGCCFHFYVEGGNGSITTDSEDLNEYARPCNDDSLCEDCPENSYLITLLCGKQGSHEVTFIAIPDDGYQVKEWRFNGQVVEGNKTNTYMATVSYKDNYNGVIIVVFEPISN